jgi:hypothetical protein
MSGSLEAILKFEIEEPAPTDWVDEAKNKTKRKEHFFRYARTLFLTVGITT